MSSLEARDHAARRAPCRRRSLRTRKVRIRDRLERREGRLAELIDRDRALDVLQAVFPEVGDRKTIDELSSRLRKQDLTSVPRGCDTCGEVHVVSYVALVGNERGARVQADAQADRARGESFG